MAVFRVQGADGHIYKIEGPDDATDDEIAAYAEQTIKPEIKPAAPETSWGDAGLIGAGKSFTRMGQGLQQAYYGLTGDNAAQDQLKQQVDEENRLYKPLQDAHPIASAVGEALPSMAIPGGAGIKTMMTAGAIPGLLEYGNGEDRLMRGAMGAGGAGIGVGAAKAIGRLVKPFESVNDPARTALTQVFEREGIPLSVANKTGNKSLKWIDSALDNLPWVADKQLAAKTAQRGEFNRAVGRTFGADETHLTPDVLDAAKKKLGQGFSDLSERNRLNFGNDTLNKVAQVQFDVERYAGTRGIKNTVNNYIDDIIGKVEPDGTISGRAYREFDSALGQRMRGTTDGDMKHYLGQVRDVFRGAMDNSISATDQQAWRSLRKQYANMHTVANTVKGSPTGDVPAAGLLQSLNSKNQNARFSGGGDLGDLARAGKEILTPLPDSGTAQRAHWMRVMGGNGLGLGALGGLLSPASAVTMAAGAGVPLGVQKAMWGGPGSKWLGQGLLTISPETEQLLRRLGHGAGVSTSRGLLSE